MVEPLRSGNPPPLDLSCAYFFLPHPSFPLMKNWVVIQGLCKVIQSDSTTKHMCV